MDKEHMKTNKFKEEKRTPQKNPIINSAQNSIMQSISADTYMSQRLLYA